MELLDHTTIKPPARVNHSVRRPGFATITEAADYLRVSQKQVRRFIQRGFFKPCKAIRKILIPWTQLEDFVRDTL